jgi:23S rRNA-/tRNA-specific pseudouridylate synthase
VADQHESVEDGEIERPDAQDAAHVERFDMDVAGLLALAKEQFDDQERTQQKEDRYTERAGGQHAEERVMEVGIEGDVIHPVECERAKEGEEAEHIKLRSIEACGGRPRGRGSGLIW